jgi:hypothetical protein
VSAAEESGFLCFFRPGVHCSLDPVEAVLHAIAPCLERLELSRRRQVTISFDLVCGVQGFLGEHSRRFS